MLTSHRILQQYWHDDRYDPGQVRVWYTDRGAPEDRSVVDGADIDLEPYYLNLRTPAGEKRMTDEQKYVFRYREQLVGEDKG